MTCSNRSTYTCILRRHFHILLGATWELVVSLCFSSNYVNTRLCGRTGLWERKRCSKGGTIQGFTGLAKKVSSLCTHDCVHAFMQDYTNLLSTVENTSLCIAVTTYTPWSIISSLSVEVQTTYIWWREKTLDVPAATSTIITLATHILPIISSSHFKRPIKVVFITVRFLKLQWFAGELRLQADII